MQIFNLFILFNIIFICYIYLMLITVKVYPKVLEHALQKMENKEMLRHVQFKWHVLLGNWGTWRCNDLLVWGIGVCVAEMKCFSRELGCVCLIRYLLLWNWDTCTWTKISRTCKIKFKHCRNLNKQRIVRMLKI